ncbi:MAG: STAS domain-containing protein [Deltaproteobacteria bacterium]|nr:STAS domain-containing protein [Deltaproteobacteria bacterium]
MFSLRQVQDVAVINLLGEIDDLSLNIVGNMIHDLLEVSMNKVVLNFELVEHVNYKSLAALLDQTLKIRKLSGDIKCAHMSTYTWEIFKFVGADQVLKIYDSVDDAVMSFDYKNDDNQTWH